MMEINVSNGYQKWYSIEEEKYKVNIKVLEHTVQKERIESSSKIETLEKELSRVNYKAE